MGALEHTRRGQRPKAATLNALIDRSQPGGQVSAGFQFDSQQYSNHSGHSKARPMHGKAGDEFFPYSVFALKAATSTAIKQGIASRFHFVPLTNGAAQNLLLFTNGNRQLKDAKFTEVTPITPWSLIRVIAATVTTDEPENAKMAALADVDVKPLCGDMCGPIAKDVSGVARTLFSKTRGGFVCVGDGMQQKIQGTTYDMVDVMLSPITMEWWGQLTASVDFADTAAEFSKVGLQTSAGVKYRWAKNGDGNIDSGTYASSKVIVTVSNIEFFYDIRQILGCPV